MTPRSIGLLLFVAGTALCAAAITPTPKSAAAPAANRTSTAPKAATTAHSTTSSWLTTHPTKDVEYYWYTYPDDTYNDYCSTYEECMEWWYYYNGVICNTTSAGGTLIARGYIYNYYPHIAYPNVLIYAHFYY